MVRVGSLAVAIALLGILVVGCPSSFILCSAPAAATSGGVFESSWIVDAPSVGRLLLRGTYVTSIFHPAPKNSDCSSTTYLSQDVLDGGVQLGPQFFPIAISSPIGTYEYPRLPQPAPATATGVRWAIDAGHDGSPTASAYDLVTGDEQVLTLPVVATPVRQAVALSDGTFVVPVVSAGAGGVVSIDGSSLSMSFTAIPFPPSGVAEAGGTLYVATSATAELLALSVPGLAPAPVVTLPAAATAVAASRDGGSLFVLTATSSGTPALLEVDLATHATTAPVPLLAPADSISATGTAHTAIAWTAPSNGGYAPATLVVTTGAGAAYPLESMDQPPIPLSVAGHDEELLLPGGEVVTVDLPSETPTVDPALAADVGLVLPGDGRLLLVQGSTIGIFASDLSPLQSFPVPVE